MKWIEGIATCVNLGGSQLVWHPTDAKLEGTSQTPLDVKPTTHYGMLRESQILVGCGGSMQQESSSAIQFHADSDFPWYARQQG